MKVSSSDVVTNMRPSLSRRTLLIRSRAVSNCAEASHVPSLATPDFAFVTLPRPRAAGADADFSRALVSTAEMVHRRRKAYISKMVLWYGIVSCSSASRSACIMSAWVESAETKRSRILLRMAGGIWGEDLDRTKRAQLGFSLNVFPSFSYAGTHLRGIAACQTPSCE